MTTEGYEEGENDNMKDYDPRGVKLGHMTDW